MQRLILVLTLVMMAAPACGVEPRSAAGGNAGKKNAESIHDAQFMAEAGAMLKKMPDLTYGGCRLRHGKYSDHDEYASVYLTENRGTCSFSGHSAAVLESCDGQTNPRDPAPLAFDVDGKGTPGVVCPIYGDDACMGVGGLAVAYRGADGALKTVAGMDALGAGVVVSEFKELKGGGFSVEYLRYGKGQAKAELPAELVCKEYRIKGGRLVQTGSTVTLPAKNTKKIVVRQAKPSV